MHTKAIIVAALQDLYQHGPACTELGICHHVIEFAGCEEEDATYKALRKALANLFKSWPQYSGNPEYPVPGGKAAFNSVPNQWVGAYGAQRWALAEFMLHTLGQKH